MTPEQHLAVMIGDSVIRIATLAAERDTLTLKVAELTVECEKLGAALNEATTTQHTGVAHVD